VEQDPFISFLSNLTEKISVEKEHKALMEKINSEEEVSAVSPLEETLSKLQEKIAQQVQAHLEVTAPVIEPEISTYSPVVEVVHDPVIEENNFEDFVGKLKDILAAPKEVEVYKPIESTTVPVKEEVPIIESEPAVVTNYVQELEKQTTPEPEVPTNNYVTELDKISSKVAGVVEPDKVQDIKKLLEEYMEKYLKKAAVMAEYAGGGGSVAQQFANGGTMKGTLNVTGQYLSGGVDLARVFNVVGNAAVDSVVISSSANWNSAYQSLSTQAYTLFPSTSTILPTVGNNQSIGSRCSYVGSGQNNKICATNSSSYADACNYNVSIFSGTNNTVFACSQGFGQDTGAFICNTFIGGGVGNSAVANTGCNDGHIQNSTILNGCCNSIYNDGYSSPPGGICTSTIVGGTCNALSGYCITDSVIGGGVRNRIISSSNSDYPLQSIVIAGGCNNTASGYYASGSVIGGGFNNRNLGSYGVIAGGNTNKITSCCGGNFIGGGTYITICGYNGSSVIGGGYRNTTSGYSGSDVIVGGSSNTSSAYYGNNFIGAGNYNCIDGSSSGCTTGSSVIVGGIFNYILGCNSAVVGGAYNSLSASQAFIGGGFQNTGSGNYSAILGGRCNNDNGNTNVFILGSNITAPQPNYTYVNNLSSQGLIASKGTLTGSLTANSALIGKDFSNFTVVSLVTNTTAISADFSKDTLIHLHAFKNGTINSVSSPLKITPINFTAGSTIDILIFNPLPSNGVVYMDWGGVNSSFPNYQNGSGAPYIVALSSISTTQTYHFKYICIDGTLTNTFIIT
jgi:hypothetical protein